MSMTLKAELETWAAALKSYDEQDFERALELFSLMADSSKILTNMGLIHATIGEHETAVEHFVAATNLDPYLSIAHFQCGVSNFLLERYDQALQNFEDAYRYLRGNEAINYEQIGLKFKLFSAEVMFNKGLTQMNQGDLNQGMMAMIEASKQKVTEEHGVIDEAIRDRGEGYTVFSISVGVLYRPSENKIKNAKSKDYLGKAKLVVASDAGDAFTEFTGVKKLERSSGETRNSQEGENKPDVEPPALNKSPTAPLPSTEPVAPRRVAHMRSKTSVQLGSKVRPDRAAILASRRWQSLSNPVDVPITGLASSPPRSSVTLGGSNTTRLAISGTTSPGAVPPRTKMLQGTVSGVPGVGADGTRAAEETGAASPVGGPLTAFQKRPSLPRLQGQGTHGAQHSPSHSPSRSLQSGQYVNRTQGLTPLTLPPAPASAQGEEHMTQFYDAYVDLYADDPTMRSNVRPPTSTPSSGSSPRSPSSAAFIPVRTSNYTNASSRSGRAPSRGADMGVIHLNSDTSMGATGGTPRRKQTRRPMLRRVPVYDDDEGDDGFVTGEYDECEMTTIRVKLHYQGDVRGMLIPSTLSLGDFVRRVTTKFGTPWTGLRMKFTDEEGMRISLRDEGDFELAIETAREGTKGRLEGRMEVWCVDV